MHPKTGLKWWDFVLFFTKKIFSSVSYQHNYPSVHELNVHKLFRASCPFSTSFPSATHVLSGFVFSDTTCPPLVQWVPSWKSYVTAFFLFHGPHLTIFSGSPGPESKNVVPERPGEYHYSLTRAPPSPPWEARTPCLPGAPTSCPLRKQDP